MPRKVARKRAKATVEPQRTPLKNAQIKALAERLRELRTARGWSQETFADNCDLDRSHMGEVERGDVDPQWTTMVKIIRGLRMKPGEILDCLFTQAVPAPLVPSVPAPSTPSL